MAPLKAGSSNSTKKGSGKPPTRSTQKSPKKDSAAPDPKGKGREVPLQGKLGSLDHVDDASKEVAAIKSKMIKKILGWKISVHSSLVEETKGKHFTDVTTLPPEHSHPIAYSWRAIAEREALITIIKKHYNPKIGLVVVDIWASPRLMSLFNALTSISSNFLFRVILEIHTPKDVINHASIREYARPYSSREWPDLPVVGMVVDCYHEKLLEDLVFHRIPNVYVITKIFDSSAIAGQCFGNGCWTKKDGLIKETSGKGESTWHPHPSNSYWLEEQYRLIDGVDVCWTSILSYSHYTKFHVVLEEHASDISPTFNSKTESYVSPHSLIRPCDHLGFSQAIQDVEILRSKIPESTLAQQVIGRSFEKDPLLLFIPAVEELAGKNALASRQAFTYSSASSNVSNKVNDKKYQEFWEMLGNSELKQAIIIDTSLYILWFGTDKEAESIQGAHTLLQDALEGLRKSKTNILGFKWFSSLSLAQYRMTALFCVTLLLCLILLVNFGYFTYRVVHGMNTASVERSGGYLPYLGEYIFYSAKCSTFGCYYSEQVYLQSFRIFPFFVTPGAGLWAARRLSWWESLLTWIPGVYVPRTQFGATFGYEPRFLSFHDSVVVLGLNVAVEEIAISIHPIFSFFFFLGEWMQSQSTFGVLWLICFHGYLFGARRVYNSWFFVLKLHYFLDLFFVDPFLFFLLIGAQKIWTDGDRCVEFLKTCFPHFTPSVDGLSITFISYVRSYLDYFFLAVPDETFHTSNQVITPADGCLPADNRDDHDKGPGFYPLFWGGHSFRRPVGRRNFETGIQERNLKRQDTVVNCHCHEESSRKRQIVQDKNCKLTKTWQQAGDDMYAWLSMYSSEIGEYKSYKLSRDDWASKFDSGLKRERAKRAVEGRKHGQTPHPTTELFGKTNELIKTTTIDGEPAVKERTIGSPPTTLGACVATHVDAVFASAKHFFSWKRPYRFFREDGTPAMTFLHIGSGMTAADLTDWANAAMSFCNASSDDVYCIIIAGDDCLVIASEGDIISMYEADASSFDSTNTVHALAFEYRLMRMFGMDRSALDELRKSDYNKFVSKDNKEFTKQCWNMPVSRTTGRSDTTAGNCFTMGGSLLYATTQGRLCTFRDTQESLGFSMKAKFLSHLEECTFLKGWWVKTLKGPEYVWYPLPSAVIKLGSIKRDPQDLFPKLGDKAWLACLSMYSKSLSHISMDYPILGPLLYLYAEMGREVTLSQKDERRFEEATSKPHKPQNDVDETAYLLDVDAITQQICHRYGFQAHEIEEFAEFVLNLFKYDRPQIIGSPLLERMFQVDYN